MIGSILLPVSLSNGSGGVSNSVPLVHTVPDASIPFLATECHFLSNRDLLKRNYRTFAEALSFVYAHR